jgi:hypothetical protein
MLAKAKPIRDTCLLPRISTSHQKSAHKNSNNGGGDQLTTKFDELIRKMWNPGNFKGHVSPAEFMSAVSEASKKRFKCDQKATEAAFGGQADPCQFLAWLMGSI